MKVYIVLLCEDYEGDLLIDVYSSEAKAQEIVNEQNRNISANARPYQRYTFVEKEVL